MFYLTKINKLVPKRVSDLMKKNTIFQIIRKDIGEYSLYYEDRKDYKLVFKNDEVIFHQDGSLYPYNEYEKYGNGLFFIIKISSKSDYIEILSDKINSRPIFYTKGFDAFSSHLLLLKGKTLNIDMDILNYFLLFSYNPLFEKTIDKNIKQTMPGSIHKIKNGKMTECSKFNSIFDYIPSKEEYGDTSFYQNIDKIYKDSFKKIITKSDRMHVQLSGGIDSRGCLSEIYKQYDGDIQTHGYGPSFHADNIIAKKVVQNLDRATHNIYDFNNGDDILNFLDNIIFNSSLNTRFDDVFRCFIISKDMGHPQEPIFSSVSIDSLFGDENYPWMSKNKFFGSVTKKRILWFLCLLNYDLSTSMFDKSKINDLRSKLYSNYKTYLPKEINESDGFDCLNIMVRHGKGTIGMMNGTLPFRPMIIPLLNNDILRFSFRMQKSFKQKMMGYATYLLNFSYHDAIKSLPVTRNLINLKGYIEAVSSQISNPVKYNLSRIMYKLNKYKSKYFPLKKGNSISQLILEDYFIIFYHNNKKLREFVNDNVKQFDSRNVVKHKYYKHINNPSALRMLLTVAMLNYAIENDN